MTTTINDDDDDNQLTMQGFQMPVVIYRKTTINDNDDDAGGENPWSHTAGWLPHGPPSFRDAENHGLDLDEHGHDCGGADDADADRY